MVQVGAVESCREMSMVRVLEDETWSLWACELVSFVVRLLTSLLQTMCSKNPHSTLEANQVPWLETEYLPTKCLPCHDSKGEFSRFPKTFFQMHGAILEKTVLSNRLPTFVCRNSGVTIWGFIQGSLRAHFVKPPSPRFRVSNHTWSSFVGDCRCAETKTLAVRKLLALQLSSKSYQFTIIKQLLQLIFFRELDDGFSVLSTAVPRGFSCHTRASRVQLYSGVFQLSSVVQREEWEGNMFCSNWQQYANMFMNFIPVVPHKAVAEVSSRGKL